MANQKNGDQKNGDEKKEDGWLSKLLLLWLRRGFILQTLFILGLLLIANPVCYMLGGWLRVLQLDLIAGFLLYDSYTQVPPIYYGVLTILDRRVMKFDLPEGPIFVPPLISKVEMVPNDPDEFPIDIRETAKDGLQVRVRGTLQFRADRGGTARRYVELDMKFIKNGIARTVQSELGNIIGKRKGDDFIEDRDIIVLIMDSVLKLEVPPHEDPSNDNYTRDIKSRFDLKTRTEGKLKKVKLKDLLEGPAGKEMVRPEYELDFYRDNRVVIKKMHQKERATTISRSPTEKLYGIVIMLIRIDVDFTEEVQRAKELEQQRLAEGRAAEAQSKQQLEIMKRYMDKGGLAPLEALNATQVLLKQREGKVVSFEGFAGPAETIARAIGGTLGKRTAGGAAKPDQDQTDDIDDDDKEKNW